MDKLKIVCPNCRSLLEIGNAPGISDKMLTCPICRFRAKVAVYQQQALGKNRQTDSNDDPPTQVNPGTMDRTVGSLYFGKKEFSLHKGENTIGRKAKTGHAEVQICDEYGEVDMYMSKQHAIITIKDGASGLEHRLQPTKPKNPIRINGQLLTNEDIVVLQWGNELTFGHTVLKFDRPQSADDQTLFDPCTSKSENP